MEELFDLLQRFWWVIGFVILRMVLSNYAKKNKRTDSSRSTVNSSETRKSQLQEYLEKMRAEIALPEASSAQSLPPEIPFSSDDEDDSAFLGHVSAPLPPEPKKQVKIVKEKRFTILPEVYQQPVVTTETPLYVAVAEKKSFPENLDYLPPMQRALVFSEIFGPPKGLE
jgi:hypothetical protein